MRKGIVSQELMTNLAKMQFLSDQEQAKEPKLKD